MGYRFCHAYNQDTRESYFRDVLIPGNFYSRAKGLLAFSELGDQQGMLFEDCKGVHMFGMRFSIDVIFMDGNGCVIKCVSNLAPWRVAFSANAKTTLEVAAGSINAFGIMPGINLVFEKT
jgi:uncharacterized membrane protein (UPF0127 family)